VRHALLNHRVAVDNHRRRRVTATQLLLLLLLLLLRDARTDIV